MKSLSIKNIILKNTILTSVIIILLLLCSWQNTEAQVSGAQFDSHPMHWARFWARGLFDRNLIWCPVWNFGNLTDSGVEPSKSMRWPGSEGLNYVGKANFYIGALITDMAEYRGQVVPNERDGQTFPIVSVSYLPHTAVGIVAKLSSDKTHQQIWQPMPYYFNDGQFGVIWGINEDVNKDGELQPEEDINYNGILDYNLDPPESILKSMAISTDKRTWPEYWPAGSYIGDTRISNGRPPSSSIPGSRAGYWNGEYKRATIADQETLYRMDDHENDYLNDFKKPLAYWPMKNADGTPDTTLWLDGGIAGAGVEVESRTYAWFHPLAEDLLVSVYRVRNYSDYTLDRIVTGMFADADVGQSEYNAVDYILADYAEQRGRLSFDILYQWHQFPEQIETWKKIGTFGFAFLESPGIDYNFKDDDADSLIDESMSNNFDDDGDWRPFADVGLDRKGPMDEGYTGPDADGTENNGVWDTEDTNLNGALDVGEDKNENDKLDMEPVNDDRGTDGIGPDENGWPGPDDDGSEVNGVYNHGEPNYDETDIDEADQAGLKHVYAYEPNTTDLKIGEVFWDKFLRWETEGDEGIEDTDENIAFTFGARAVKLDTMKWRRFVIAMIMGEDQNDAIRNKATMQQIYNNNYRFLTPPLQPTVVSNTGSKRVQLYWDTDAESSLDQFFGEDFNGYRVYRSTNPKFLDIKTITDAFGNVLLFEPLVIYDRIENDEGGLSGPHPIPFPNLGVHYDMGDNSGLRHSYTDSTVENGRTYYYAVNSIDAGNDDDFFDRKIVSIDYPMQAMPSECGFSITVNELGEVVYRDKNTAVVVPSEPAAGYVNPYVDSTKIRHISGYANGGNLRIEVFNKHHARLGNEYEISFEDDHWLDDLTGDERQWGSTTGMRCINVTTGDTLFDNHYETAYYFNQDAFVDVEKSIFEGLKFFFDFPVNNRDREKEIEINQENEYGRKTKQWQRWTTDTNSNLRVEDIELGGEGFALPYDLEIRVGDALGEGKSVKNAFWEQEFDTNFSLWNISDPNNPEKLEMKVIYGYARRERPPEEYYGQIWEGTNIVVMFKDKSGYYQASWNLIFLKNELEKDNEVIPPEPGDVFRVRFFSNPTRFDKYRFTVDGGEYNEEQAKLDMRDIYVVPDPYVVASDLESIYELAGFSQRRVDFVNLPPECTIKVFTASGKLVKTIYHNSANDFGRHSWDLTTEDGPEIAFGMYFFVVESKELGISRGKFAVIK